MKPNYIKDSIEDLIQEPNIIYEELINDYRKKHLNHTSVETIELAHEIRKAILIHGQQTGGQLGYRFNKSGAVIRKAIQHMRMYYTWVDHYLVADYKGYYFTDDKEIITKFLHKTLTRFKNTHPQINQMLFLLTKDNNG